MTKSLPLSLQLGQCIALQCAREEDGVEEVVEQVISERCSVDVAKMEFID